MSYIKITDLHIFIFSEISLIIRLYDPIFIISKTHLFRQSKQN